MSNLFTPGKTVEALAFRLSTSSQSTQSASCDLVIHSNHWHISYRVRYKRQFSLQKLQILHIPLLNAPVMGFLLEFCNGSRSQETRMMSLPDRQNIDYMSTRLDTISALDVRWTDRRMKQEAELTLTNPHDAFRGQSRSPNMVPFDMLGIVSY